MKEIYCTKKLYKCTLNIDIRRINFIITLIKKGEVCKMKKLYRLIPDSVASVCEKGYLCDISEDLFYKVGYISTNDHMDSYFKVEPESWARKTEQGTFFYFSPWNCLVNLLYIQWHYYSMVARIFEYEVDEEIVNNCPQGFGHYNNITSKEIRIPLNILAKENTINTELNPKLKNKLNAIALSDAKEVFKYIKEYAKSNKNSQLHHIEDFDSFEYEYFNSGRAERVNARRLKECGMFFKSSIITGKSIIITKEQRELLYDFLNNPNENLQQIYELCENSNGIFTLESLNDFIDNYGGCNIRKLIIKPTKK